MCKEIKEIVIIYAKRINHIFDMHTSLTYRSVLIYEMNVPMPIRYNLALFLPGYTSGASDTPSKDEISSISTT
jgi:hypothetical protein